jgi:hypothetical protein
VVNAVILDSYNTSREAGRIAGRLIFLIVIPVFVIAFIYWLTGRSRPQPRTFGHAITRWWVWVVGLVTGFVLLVGLGYALAAPAAARQAALEATASALPDPTIPTGWTMQRDTANGAEIALPDAWAKARSDPKYFESDVARSAAAHPDVADVLRRVNQAAAGKGLRLIAVDPTQPSGYYSNVLLLIDDAGFGPSLDRLASGYVSGIEESTSVQKPVTRENVTLPVGPAVRVQASSVPVNGVTVTEISYVMLHGRQGKSDGVIIVFSCASDQLPTMQTITKQAIDSFRYLN